MKATKVAMKVVTLMKLFKMLRNYESVIMLSSTSIYYISTDMLEFRMII